MSRADKISAEAADWLIRLETASSPELWDGLQTWLDANARHRAAFVRLRVAWHRVDALKNLRPVDGTIDPDLLIRDHVTRSLPGIDGAPATRGARKPAEQQPASSLRRRWLAAVSAALAVGVVTWLIGRPAWKHYETAVGGHDEVTLADGTRLQLNTNTELRVRISRSRREVSLLQGEALFFVTHDPEHPFVVAAGHTLVRALGTEFSVRIRGAGHVDVLVADGRVAVSEEAATQFSPAVGTPAAEVSAGESADAGQPGISVQTLPSSELVRRLAWTSGHLSFQGETLEEATQEFNRYNRLQIIIGDRSIAGYQVGGIFLARDPLSFVAALQRSFGIQATRSGDEVRLRLGSDNED